MSNQKCPLCKNTNINLFSVDKKREYLKCEICSTIFVPNQYYLSEEDEKKRYDLHTNSNNDKYYLEFLKRIVIPIKNHIEENSIGLDFGCGPGPILKQLFAPYNISISEYDLYYKNDLSLLEQKWDFIVTTEVVEHLKDPYSVLVKLWALVKKGGLLGIMTSLYNDNIAFPSWYYKGDPTHITFFTKESFIWLSKDLMAEIYFFDKDIIILKKN